MLNLVSGAPTDVTQTRTVEATEQVFVNLIFIGGCKMFEVLHETLIDGWVNTWTVTDSEGREFPEYFKTETAAKEALDDFLEDNNYEGRDEEFMYSSDEFMVSKVEQ